MSDATLDDTHAGELPLAARRAEDMPGHWLMARLGKKVLRPGGKELTRALIAEASVTGRDLVELAPGLGLTAGMLLDEKPASYTGVDDDEKAVALCAQVVGDHGRVIVGNAKSTGLADESADVVFGEAMLTMNTDRTKGQILDEVWRVLRPGGRYVIHELSLVDDDMDAAGAKTIRTNLAKTMKVNARPLQISEWLALFEQHGFVVRRRLRAEMALLRIRRLFADEGVFGVMRIGKNYLLHRDIRARVKVIARTFAGYKDRIAAIGIVAEKVDRPA